MDSKEDFKCGSSGDGAGAVVIAGEFPSDSSEGIIPPPPQQAWAYNGTDGNAAPSPPYNINLDAAPPPAPTAPTVVIAASSTSSKLANAGGLAVKAASRWVPPFPGEVEPERFLPPAAVGGCRPSDNSPSLTTSTARPPPEDKEDTLWANRNERDDGHEEEKRAEGEDNKEEAPHLPEMVAAAFEEAKPELFYHDDNAPAPQGQISPSLEGHGHEEEKREEGNDDEAPRPPDMIAASFEDDGGCGEEELEEGEDKEAPHPPSMVAASFEAGHGCEEEKREDGEDAEAPRPPSMMTKECEDIVATGHESMKKPPVSNQDGVAPQVPEEQIVLAQEGEENITIMQDIVNTLMREIDDVFNNDGTPVHTEIKEVFWIPPLLPMFRLVHHQSLLLTREETNRIWPPAIKIMWKYPFAPLKNQCHLLGRISIGVSNRFLCWRLSL
jgi:hypothetical protein